MSDRPLRLGEAYAPTLVEADAAKQIGAYAGNSVWTREAVTDMDAFRREAEIELARLIIARAEFKDKWSAHANYSHALALYGFEINGACIITRALGGYGSQSFDVLWAEAVRERNPQAFKDDTECSPQVSA